MSETERGQRMSATERSGVARVRQRTSARVRPRTSIVADVKNGGEEAARKWALELDGVDLVRAVPNHEALPRQAVLDLASRVRRWHRAQRPADIELEVEPGVLLTRRWVALDSVGVYVPRNLVSTLVMCCVPAQEAGVDRIVVCTPPSGAGLVAAAAELLGIGEIWAIGGAQAIGWLAYVQGVAKIVGPGNAYVNEAKLEVWRDVPIDLPGGPSEVVVVMGPGADRRLADLELAAQCEHGPDSIGRVVDTLAEAEALAPEHLVLLGDDAADLAPQVRNAGVVFVGQWSPVPAGDYATGGNHVLPTGGWARSVGGLGLETFLKPITTQTLSEDGMNRIRPTVEALAAAEGMPLHAAAMQR